MPSLRKVIFVTPVFVECDTGPATYARYLWDAFRDHPELEFHLVAPQVVNPHPRGHAAGRGRSSLNLYEQLSRTALLLARQLGGAKNNVLVHVNNSNLHSSLLSYDGPLWGQINDYENADWWRRAGETIRRAGWRRFFALGRRRWLERRFVARQDLTLCISDYTRQKIVAEYPPVHPDRIITFPKAVDVGFFRRPSPAAGQPPAEVAAVRRFVFVGSDVVRKGLDTLLRAVALFPADFNWQAHHRRRHPDGGFSRISQLGVDRVRGQDSFCRKIGSGGLAPDVVVRRGFCFAVTGGGVGGGAAGGAGGRPYAGGDQGWRHTGNYSPSRCRDPGAAG